MARGQRKPIEEKIAEKEKLIEALKVRLKSEQGELDALYREKRDRDLEGLNQLLADAGIDIDEASDILQSYIQNREEEEQSA